MNDTDTTTTDTKPMTSVQRLRQARRNARGKPVSRAQLAAASKREDDDLGLSPSTIWSIEKRERKAVPTTLAQLVRGLNSFAMADGEDATVVTEADLADIAADTSGRAEHAIEAYWERVREGATPPRARRRTKAEMAAQGRIDLSPDPHHGDENAPTPR